MTEAALLREWGDHLVARLAQDPQPDAIDCAKRRLLDRYCRAHARISADHWTETSADNHDSLSRALQEVWQQLEALSP